MSQRVWLASVMAAAFGVVAIMTERSQSQEENSQRDPFAHEANGRSDEANSEFDPFAAEAGGSSESLGERKVRQAAATTIPAVPRIWVTEDPERTEQLFEILKSPLPSAGLQFPDGTPLEEIIAFLREEYDVEILLDMVALDELGIGPDEPVSISIQNIRVDQAMRRMLEPMELTCIVEDGVLLITSEDEASTSKLIVAIYDVRDLLLKGDFDPLIDIITSTIAPSTWAENGGGEAEIRVYPQRGGLVVSQTISVHEAIAGLLTAMRELPVDTNAEHKVEGGGPISFGNPGHGPSYGSKASQQQGLVLPSNGAPH